MAAYSGYYYDPYPLYPVNDPWRTTWVPHHFPEHHYPLENVRHTLGRSLSSIGHALVHPLEHDPPVYCPRADIRESEGSYYIDVELPGIEGRDRVKLKWLSNYTLLVEAHTKKPVTDEEGRERAANKNEVGTERALKSTDHAGAINDTQKAEKQAPEKENANDAELNKHNEAVYTILKERQIGILARAFNFSTKVDHKALVAELDQGLLRLKVRKVSEFPVKEEHKTPEVQEGSRKGA